jgi:hypothetical protein
MSKMYVFSFFILSLLNQGAFAQQGIPKKFSSQLRFHTQELAITSEKVSKEMYKSLDTKEEEADLVHALFFKYGEFLYCHKEPEESHLCATYLKFNGQGELSSFRTDADFGKGDVIEAIITKPVVGKGSVTATAEGFDLEVKGKLAGFLYNKMNEVYADYDEKENRVIESKKGKDMQCNYTLIKRENGNKKLYYCKVSVKMNRDNRPELPINPKMDSQLGLN